MNDTEKRILRIIDDNAPRLQALADDLFTHPEQGWYETRTAAVAAGFLQSLGLNVRTGLAVTGLRASVGTGKGPNIALIGELDALKCPDHPASRNGYAHSCGHYAQMVCLLGAALALSDPEVASSLDGTATFFAVPAEEFQDAPLRELMRREHDVHCGGGKCELLRRGAFDDSDMALTAHSHMVGRDSGADLLLGNSASTGFVGKTVTIRGVASHAAASPDRGVNALNAACLGLSALGMIRETFREADCVRVHPVIREGGQAINVVPSRAVVEMQVRANKIPVIGEISEKVNNCFRGAALAIGCTAEIEDAQGYLPCPEILPTPLMFETAALLGDCDVRSIPVGVCNTASTDVGDLCAVMPVMNFTFGGSVGALHTADYAVTDPYVAHILPAKMMALLAYRLLRDGAAAAKDYIAGYSPAMSLEEYKAYCRRMSP
ncbi:MAG: amidohydrolase [Oscillospiraceae bacterium]|nr:amidohydrolase [Oscillospiraceae bacterium]